MAGEVKKKLRPGAIEVHPTECALVVLYEVQEVFVHENGSKTIQSSSQATKKIPVKNLNERVDLNETAQEIVEKCKLIHPGKVNLVEELLQQLLLREGSAGRGHRHEDERKPSSRPSSARRSGLDAEERAEVQRRSEAAQASLFKSQQKQYEPAVLDRLDDYIEELYEEDMARKLKATGMIAMLFRNTQNFEAVELMGTGRFQPVVLGLLYHLSIDDKCKSMFSYTDAVSRLYDMMMRVQDLRNTPELIALVVNLTQNSRNAEVMCDGERFDVLVRRAFQTCDELAFKVVRNLSQVEARTVKQKFGPYIERMVLLLQAPGIPAELFVEVLGTLANCYIPEFDFLELVRKHSLLQFLASYCQPREVDDDILLEVIMFVGILCNDGTAPLLVASGLVNTLFNLMGDKKEDDEFVLQIAFTFQKFLLQGPTRDALLHNTEVVLYLVDLLQDKNKEVRKVADACLDIIMDSSEELAVNIRNLKFEAYNQEWLEAVGHNPNKHMMSVAMPVRPAMTNGKVIMADEGEVEYGTMSDVLGAYKLGDTHLSDFEDLGETQRLWTGGRDDIGIGLDSPGHFGIDYDEDEFRRNYECY